MCYYIGEDGDEDHEDQEEDDEGHVCHSGEEDDDDRWWEDSDPAQSETEEPETDLVCDLVLEVPSRSLGEAGWLQHIHTKHLKRPGPPWTRVRGPAPILWGTS